MENERVKEAADLIIKFDLHARFDVKDIILRLIEVSPGAHTTVKMLLNTKPDILPEIVHAFSTQKHYKLAAIIVKDFRLNAADFPEL